MSTMTIALQQATPAAAARVRVPGVGVHQATVIDHGTWQGLSASPSYAMFGSTLGMSNDNGTCTKRPTRRLEKRLT